MKRVVIKSSEWARGGEQANYLLGVDGSRCCLGIDAKAYGISDDLLYGEWVPNDLNGIQSCIPWVSAWESLDTGVPLSDKAIAINDSEGLTDEERVAKLRPIFRAAGRILVWRPDL